MKIPKRRLCHCHRCGYDWLQNRRTKNLPETCANPQCRSRIWNKRKKAA